MSASIWQTCMLVPGLSRDECASWVQAWGTIGALAVAIGIAWWQTGLARRLRLEELENAKREREAKSRWMVALAVIARIKRAAYSVELLTQVPSETGLSMSLAVFEDVRRRLAEVPIFDLPNAAFAEDLLVLGQTCSLAREQLLGGDGAAMRSVVETCDKILANVLAAGQRSQPASD
jgi:hypothetical protein